MFFNCIILASAFLNRVAYCLILLSIIVLASFEENVGNCFADIPKSSVSLFALTPFIKDFISFRFKTTLLLPEIITTLSIPQCISTLGDTNYGVNEIFGVDTTEQTVATDAKSQYAPAHAGWVGITSYTDQHGNLRVKTEVLVASSSITGGANDASDDTILPDS